MEKNKRLRHVAIIMDGNGRWAAQHGLQRVEGHMRGAERVVDFINYVKEFKIEYVTLYAFSTENWSRSKEEVDALMELLCQFLDENLNRLLDSHVRLMVTGRIDGLPEKCQKRLYDVMDKTSKHYEYSVILALNYGGRPELTDAIRKIAAMVKSGSLQPEDISEKTIAENLYLPEVPDPDLVIRTSGELRLSNFLLWETSYSEFYFTDVFWPDFDVVEFRKAVDSFYNRNRRFGGRPC